MRGSGLLQDLEAGYLLEEGDDFKAGTLILAILKILVTDWFHTESDPAKAYTKMLEKFNDYHPDIVNALRYVTWYFILHSVEC